MIILDIWPIGQGRFAACIEDQLIIKSSRSPFLDAARALIARGASPDALMVMRHPNDTPSLKSTLGVAARFCVREGQREAPRFAPWQPDLRNHA